MKRVKINSSSFVGACSLASMMAHAIIQLNPALLPLRLDSHLPVLVPVVARDCPLSLILYPLLPPLTLYLACALSGCGSILFSSGYFSFGSFVVFPPLLSHYRYQSLYLHFSLSCIFILNCNVGSFVLSLFFLATSQPLVRLFPYLSLFLSLLYQSPPLYQFLSRTFITVTRRVFIFLTRVTNFIFFSKFPFKLSFLF